MNIGGKDINVLVLDDSEWLSAQDAAWYLTVRNAREDNPIPADYPRNLVRNGLLRARKLNERMSVYALDDLSKIVVRSGPGRHSKHKSPKSQPHDKL